jgi:hypothetical protein
LVAALDHLLALLLLLLLLLPRRLPALQLTRVLVVFRPGLEQRESLYDAFFGFKVE